MVVAGRRNIGAAGHRNGYCHKAGHADKSTMTHLLGRLLCIENVESIDSLGVTLASRWAEERPFWLFLLAIAVMAGSIAFYWRWQSQGNRWCRVILGLFRGALLLLLL